MLDNEANELERLLAAAAADPVARPTFARALLASRVYVLGCLDRPTVGGAAQTGSAMKLLTWSDEHGSITPFFTSEAMLQRTVAARPGTDARFLRMKSRDLFEMLRGQRLLLNPDGVNGKIYTASEVEALLAGKEPGLTTEVVQRQRQVAVGTAARIPPELPDVLRRFFAERPVVQAAHLGWIAHPDGHEGYLLLVVTDDRETAMAGFGSLRISEVAGGHTVDVLVVPPGSRDGMLAKVPLFYTRQPQDDGPKPKRRGWFRGRS